jgi:hypothetical protein
MKDGDRRAKDMTALGLQAAIDYGAGGKVKVFVGPGELLLPSAIAGASNLHLQGSGIGKTVLKHSGTTLHTILSFASKSNWILSDFTIDGDQAGVTSYNADRWNREETIDLPSCADFEIGNVEITACRGQGIYGTSCTRGTIQGCWIHDTDNWGAVFKVATDIDFSQNHVENAWTHGLYVDSQTDAAGSNRVRFMANTCINVQHDTAHSASGIGISAHNAGATSGTYDVTVIGNYCKNNGAMGFSMTTSLRSQGHVGKMVVIGNHSEGHSNVGGSAGTGHGYEFIATNVSMVGNIAKNNANHITLENCQNITMSDNYIESAIGTTFIGCLITIAADVLKHSTGITFSNNIVRGGTGFQIEASTPTTPHTDITVKGNQFIHCEHGVLIQSGSVLRLDVSDNLVDANDAAVTLGRGLQVGGDSVTVKNNTIWAKGATSGDAIVVLSGQTTDVLHLIGNRVLAGRYGLSVSGAVLGAYASGNVFTGILTADTNAKSNVTAWRDGGDNSWNYNAAAPVAEYWHVGTRVYDTAVAAAGFIGFVCTTAGTPGTWKTFGAVSA